MQRMARKKATAAKNRKTNDGKPATKRKRFGKTGADTRQAKTSQRAAKGTKQARQAARTRLLREARSLALAASEAIEAGDLEAAQAFLATIARRGDK
jgi:hypothetical protein